MRSDSPSSAALLALLLLAGCGNEIEPQADGWTGVSTTGGAAGVKEIVLPSGRHCVVLVGSYKGAITCDWK